jgi:hypothetical protein
MRGFIDRARDLAKIGMFSTSEMEAVTAALNLYDSLRTDFSITEEDIENVENLLSLADLSRILRTSPVNALMPSGLSDHLRRFIDAVITKSISIPGPASPLWLEYGAERLTPYKQLTRSLAHYGERITVITLNYDCLIEYTCYCMGLPFTYNRALSPGAEILKLHGSTNWLRCPNQSCDRRGEPYVSEIKHVPGVTSSDTGHIERSDANCVECRQPLTPIIVPPSWTKDIDAPILRETWSRAANALAKAEVLVGIGYSLPVADMHVQQLLHIGFSSRRLRQALVAVGSDEESAQRWTAFFRESWRSVRLTVRAGYFQDIVNTSILPALVIPDHFGRSFNEEVHVPLIPLRENCHTNPEVRERFRAAMKKGGIMPLQNDDLSNVNWSTVAKEARAGKQTQDSNTQKYREILDEAGMIWSPTGSILPAHGRKLQA